MPSTSWSKHRAGPSTASPPRRLDGRSPSELFGAYLADEGVDDPRLCALFDELLEEVTSP